MSVRRFLATLSILALALGVSSLHSWSAPQTSKKKSSSRKSAAKARKLQHLHRAFVASTELKPMAHQLLQFRSEQAYWGVAAYAQKHEKDEAGPLAWMVIGYAHYLDKDYAKALSAWQRSNELAPVLGDYLDYLRAGAQNGLGNHAAVIKTLEGFEQKYPDSLFSHDSTILYAQALIATAYYQKLSENYRYYYYANLGRQRLLKLGFANVGDPPLLDKLPLPSAPPNNWVIPEDNVRVKKAQLLANAAMFDFAERELQAAASGNPPWLAAAQADLYADAGNYFRTIETLKRAIPGYFSADLNQLPHPVWQGLFPRPYWEDLKRNSLLHQLDPYLVASLIRQESEFNPAALSRANAMGLMQLLPHVGKGLAKEEKIKHFSTDELFVANINIQLGTRYFKHMVDHYQGQVEYALAAYNPGEDRVDDWRNSGNFKDVEEFVESIPFTQTREYVQAIMRNAVLYKLLYPAS